jgi:hypothetical protein
MFRKVVIEDVGQGSCSWIDFPLKPLLLFDFGSSEAPDEKKGDKQWKQLLANQICQKASARGGLELIVSHPDKDHVNALSLVLKGIKGIKPQIPVLILLGGGMNDYKTRVGKELLRVILETKFPHFFSSAKDTFLALSEWRGEMCILSSLLSPSSKIRYFLF